MKSEKIAATDRILKNKKIFPENIKQNLKLIFSLFLNHLMKIYIKEKIDKRPTMRNDPQMQTITFIVSRIVGEQEQNKATWD